MPQVKKQVKPSSPSPKVPPKVGMPVTVVEHSTLPRGMKACFYGRGKTGKTRLACTFPGRKIIFGGEDGWKSLGTDLSQKPRFVLGNGTKAYTVLLRGKPLDIDFIRLTESAELEELIQIAVDQYASGILDTGGGLQDIIVKEVGGFAEIPVQRSWGLLKKDQWGIVNSQWKERVRTFLDLADRSSFNAVVIAHERDFSKEGDVADPELLAPDIGPDLTPGSSRWLNGACDYVGNMYIRRQTELRSISGIEGQTPVQTGKMEYCLRIGSHGVYTTGFRCCLPPGEELPDMIVNPTYDKIRKIIEG